MYVTAVINKSFFFKIFMQIFFIVTYDFLKYIEYFPRRKSQLPPSTSVKVRQNKGEKVGGKDWIKRKLKTVTSF